MSYTDELESQRKRLRKIVRLCRRTEREIYALAGGKVALRVPERRGYTQRYVHVAPYSSASGVVRVTIGPGVDHDRELTCMPDEVPELVPGFVEALKGEQIIGGANTWTEAAEAHEDAHEKDHAGGDCVCRHALAQAE